MIVFPVAAAAVATAIELVHGRFPTDGGILTSLITAALSDPDSVTTEVEDLVLQLLDKSDSARQAIAEEPGLQQQCHRALWNHAVFRFSGKQFESAVKLFAASLTCAQVGGWVVL